jgi:hypothetical protein
VSIFVSLSETRIRGETETIIIIIILVAIPNVAPLLVIARIAEITTISDDR